MKLLGPNNETMEVTGINGVALGDRVRVSGCSGGEFIGTVIEIRNDSMERVMTFTDPVAMKKLEILKEIGS